MDGDGDFDEADRGGRIWARFAAGAATAEPARARVSWWDLRALYDDVSGATARLEKTAFSEVFLNEMKAVYNALERRDGLGDGQVPEAALLRELSEAAKAGSLRAFMHDVDGDGEVDDAFAAHVVRRQRAAKFRLAMQQGGAGVGSAQESKTCPLSPRAAGAGAAGGFGGAGAEEDASARMSWSELLGYCFSIKASYLAPRCLKGEAAKAAAAERMARR